MAYHAAILWNGVGFDLGHLDPVVFLTPSDKLGREIRTWCRFTTHTFSRSADPAETGPFLVDEGKRLRVFCPDRYALSVHLPAAIGLLSDPRRYVWQTTAERNWLHRTEVDVLVGGARVGYQVFFAVKKAGRAAPYDVELTVESAYAFDAGRRPKVGGKMLIAGVLTATVEKRAVRTLLRG